MNKTRIDVTGQTFNRLTAISYIGNGLYNCKCICGSSIKASSYQLRRGKIKSCGCLNKEMARINGRKNKSKKLLKDLSGQIFDRLTVIRYIGKRYFECKCICRVVKNIRGDHLTSNIIKSCGCLKRKI